MAAQGEAKGKAEVLLMFLRPRGLAITDDQTACDRHVH